MREVRCEPSGRCCTALLGRGGFSPRKQTEGEDVWGWGGAVQLWPSHARPLRPTVEPSKAGLRPHPNLVNLNPWLEPVYYQFVKACPVIPVRSKLRASLLT